MLKIGKFVLSLTTKWEQRFPSGSVGSPESRAFLKIMRGTRRVMPLPSTLEALRKGNTKMAELRSPSPCFVSREVHVAGVRCLWTYNTAAPTAPIVVWFHGGGYVLGSPEATQAAACDFAEGVPCHVLLSQYRLLPENKCADSLTDAMSVYQHLVNVAGVPSNRIILMGESAGANLAVRTAIAIRDAQLPPPACVVAWSPPVDFSGSRKSYADNADKDVLLAPSITALIGKALATQDIAPFSLQSADMTGVAPLFVSCAGDERLADDGPLLAGIAQRAGVDVELDVTPGMFHVYQTFLLTPEATAIHAKTRDFILKRVGGVPHDVSKLFV